MINRAAVILRYKAPAVRWINEADPDSDLTLTVEEVNRDGTVYLIGDDMAETRADLRAWVEANFRTLFEVELEAWYTDPDLWPQDLSLALFDQWFEVECRSLIVDTDGGPLLDEDFC